MTRSSAAKGKKRTAQPVPPPPRRPSHPARDDTPETGFTLIEVLLAVGLLAIIAVTALHSRSVMIRAEHKGFRLNEGRFLMRGLVAAKRAGMDEETLRETLPGEWQLTDTRVMADITDSAETRQAVPWRIWQLHHQGSDAALEIAMEDIPLDPDPEGIIP